MPVDENTRKAAAEALAAINQYDRERFSHGVDRIRLYYSDVEGDWLNEFQNNTSHLAQVIDKYRLDPQIVANYLRHTHWRETEVVENHHSIWKLQHPSQSEYTLLLPLNLDIPDFLNRMYDVIRTLAAIEKRPETEFLNDLASATQIAQEKGREILNIHLDFHQERTNLQAPAKKLGIFFTALQDILNAIGQFECGKANPMGKISQEITDRTNLDLIGIFNGSFGIRLAAAPPTHEQFNLLEPEIPLAETVMNDFIDLVNSSSDGEKFRALMLKFQRRSASHYRKFLMALTQTEADFRVEWGSPNASKGGTAALSRSDAWQAIEICNELVTAIPKNHKIVGKLFAVDNDHKTFRMEDIYDEKEYSGKIADEVLTGDVKIIVIPPTTYRAVIEETLVEKPNTGESSPKYRLLNLEPWSKPSSSDLKSSLKADPDS